VAARVEGVGPKLLGRIRNGTCYTPIDWPEEFPWDFWADEKGYSVYLKGNGFWNHAVKEWGFNLGNGTRTKGLRHPIFREDVALAKERGFPVLAHLLDFDLLSAKMDEWNEANPDHPVDFMTYGRGHESLKARLR